MPTFNLLNVAIGMIFFFLLLSLIASAVNEMLAALMQTRARTLEKGIIRLLGDPKLATDLYNHPLVRNLWGESKAKKDLPSYIPSQNFALALMDLMAPGTGTNDALVDTTGAVNAPAAPTGEALYATVAAMPQGPLSSALVSLLNAAGRDAAKARKNIEDWYNSTMDRISGAYKRRTQYWLFGIGLIASIGINADSVVIAQHLLANSVFAQQVVQAAQQYVGTTQNATQPPANVDAAADQLTGTLTALDGLGLPIGWSGPGNLNKLEYFGDALGAHWLGWFISAFAVSFGAPFWFDLLNRFMVVRSTVKPQEKSPEEGSKD